MRVALVSFDFGEYSIRLASALSRFATVLLVLPRHVAAPYLSELDPQVTFHPFDKPRLRHPQPSAPPRPRVDPSDRRVRPGCRSPAARAPLVQRDPAILATVSARRDGTRRAPPHRRQDLAENAASDRGLRFSAGFRLIVHAKQVKEVHCPECGFSPEIVDVVPHISLGECAGWRAVARPGTHDSVLRAHLGIQGTGIPHPRRATHYRRSAEREDRHRRRR